MASLSSVLNEEVSLSNRLACIRLVSAIPAII